MENHLDKKKLFNPFVEEKCTIINGTTSNILDLTNIPKSSERFHNIFDVIYSNNWHPVKTDMSGDKYDLKNRLTYDEKECYETIISFLAFLDSLQTNNLPNISAYTTNPNAVYVLARQTYDEAIHSRSYGHIFNSIMSKEESVKIYNKWKTNPLLLERNQFIAKIYQDFVDNPTERNYMSAVVANYILEGIYFYNGFQFFHNLANRGLMIGTDTQISYIQRDEIMHCAIFEQIITNIFNENIGYREKYSGLIKEMFIQAVEWEIKFSQATIGNKILGQTNKSIEEYTYFLGNTRLKNIGFESLFPKVKNPYKHLEKIAATEDETSNRSNNFEVTSITYKSPEILSGWDLFLVNRANKIKLDNSTGN